MSALKAGFTVLLISFFLFAFCSSASSKDRPGINGAPGFICFKTSITEKGRTRMSQIIRSSGSPRLDRGALRLVRSLKFIVQKGEKQVARDVHLLVRMHATGFAFNTIELDEPLPEICSTPV